MKDGLMSEEFRATSQFSGLNALGNGSAIFARVENTNGALFSASIGSPGVYGAFIQAGSIATSAGSTATINLKTNFANTQYALILTPQVLSAAGEGYVLSGTATKTISGANIVGAASTLYNYIAVGI